MRPISFHLDGLDGGRVPAGSYSASALSGTIAAGMSANQDILQARWTSTTHLAVVTDIINDGLAGSATAFTAGFGMVAAHVARGYTADGSGGTALTLTGNNQKLRTAMPTLGMTIRVASTGALTTGTRTLDANPIGRNAITFGTVASVIYIAPGTPLFTADGTFTHPIVLAAEEGIVIKATVPATGTWQAGFTIKWMEVDLYG